MKPLTSSDPARIGPFRIVARLGAGGMGKVYLGRAESTGKAVAIKTIHGDLVTDREFRARFAREVAAARQVRGTYIAEVVDADPDAANPWLATAYAPGISVSDAVHRSGPLPADAVRRLGVCVARAVADIHAVGLVHRDLKPDNILLTSTGPKVIDFGIARGVAEEGLTRTGMVAGSPPYMAPEQLLTGDFGTGTDVFGLAAILHFAATGVGPYGKGGVNELYGRAVTIGPVIDESLPVSLTATLGTCLTKEPAVRPSAAGLVAMLELTPGEDVGTAWLPGAVMAEILAQATEALSAESSGGGAAVPQQQQQHQQRPPQQQFARPQAGHPQAGHPQGGHPQAGRPQSGQQPGQQQRPPSWPNNNLGAQGQAQGQPHPQAQQQRGPGGSGPNWSLGPGGQQQPQQHTPPRPQQYPPQGVVNTPPAFGVPQQQRPAPGPYGPQNPYAVAAGLPGYVPAKNPKAMWAMIVALFSILAFVIPILDLIVPGLAILFGIQGNTLANQTRVGKGQALTGIILGTVILIFSFWYNIAFFKDLGSTSS